MRILSVTCIRDEGPYLLEWIAHHIGAGVSDFLVYSNDCSDGSDQMLDMLDQAGVVTHVRHRLERGNSIQWQALKTAWKHPLRKDADWILVSDLDEFANVHAEGYTLGDLIRGVGEGVDGIVLPWRLFGHNGVVDLQDAPVTAQFTRAIPAEAGYPVPATLFKTLFRAQGPYNQLGVHRPRQKSLEKHAAPVMVDGSGNQLPALFCETDQRLSLWGMRQGRSLAEMNHYSVRSAMGFVLKQARGLPNRRTKDIDLGYWVERNFNSVENSSIEKMRPATERALLELLAIPGLQALHEQAVAHHLTRFSELIRDPDVHKLFVQCLTGGGSEVLPRELQQRLVRWYQDTDQNP